MSHERPLTFGERHMLFPIFGYTLDYENQTVELNAAPNLGGIDNSITPDVVPRMAPSLWCSDYSAASDKDAAVFVHEIVHVWQSGHGSTNTARAAYLGLRYVVLAPIRQKSGYDQAYYYDLAKSTSLDYFNMEQQAAIIEDYYLLSKHLSPEKNEGKQRALSDYEPYVKQLKKAGPWYVFGLTETRERISVVKSRVRSSTR